MTPNKLDLDRIEGLARAATPGPWHADKNGLYVWAPSEKEGDFPVFDGNIEDPDQVVRARGWGYFTGNGHGALGLSQDEATERQRANVNLVAAMDPTTVLTLISYARELEGALDKADALIKFWRDYRELPGDQFHDKYQMDSATSSLRMTELAHQYAEARAALSRTQK